ncbi:MAG: translation initiation factor IF-6 [Candidatus Hydrothermarchaeaceae archaeon]
MIKLVSYNRDPNIGVVGRANDSIVLLPSDCPERFSALAADALETEVFRTSICGTSLIGSMVAMNNTSILLPKYVYGEEMRRMKDIEMNVVVVEDKYTALGNLVLLNDYGAIASSVFSDETVRAMEHALGCEVERGELAGFRTIGSIGLATNKGALIHPMVEEEKLKWVEEILRVDVDVGTVNRGTGLVRTGMIANSNGVLVGVDTTGPEMARIEDSLGLLR